MTFIEKTEQATKNVVAFFAMIAGFIQAAFDGLGLIVVPAFPSIISGLMLHKFILDTFDLPTAAVITGAVGGIGLEVAGVKIAKKLAYSLSKNDRMRIALSAVAIVIYLTVVVIISLFSNMSIEVKAFAIGFFVLAVLVYVIYADTNISKSVESLERSREQAEFDFEMAEKQREADFERDLKMKRQEDNKAVRLAKVAIPETRVVPISTELAPISKPLAEISREDAINLLIDYLAANPGANQSEAGNAIGKSRATAGIYMREVQQNGRLIKNGNGWEVSNNA